MNETECAYVGAMIDGEGWFTEGKSWGKIVTRRLGLGNTNLEIISAMLRATGVGTVSLASWRRFGKLPLWIWQVQRQGNLNEIARQCAPFSTKCQNWLLP